MTFERGRSSTSESNNLGRRLTTFSLSDDGASSQRRELGSTLAEMAHSAQKIKSEHQEERFD